MGLKSTIKDMFSSDDAQATAVETTSDPGSSASAEATNPSKTGRKFFGKRTSLPPGTGPGTSGHPVAASEIAMQDDLERSKAGQSTSGYGSDAAAAMGGTLAGTHQGTGIDRTAARDGRTRAINGDQVTTGGQALPASAKAGELGSEIEGAMRGTRTTGQTSQGLGTELLGAHRFGHTEHNGPVPLPQAGSQEHRNILRPVVHQKVRHVENEEITYLKQTERHMHHVQHHTHPIIVTEEAPEILRDNRQTVSQVKEIHSTYTPKDRAIIEDQIRQHRDTSIHGPKERSIHEKGTTTVKETLHHHVHHVIQPVIEKEVIKKERINTTIPIHEVIHEAPVIHQVKSYNPTTIDLFMKEFGALDSGGMTHDEIIKEVLRNGKCVREGDAVDSSDDMNLGNKKAQGTSAHTHNVNNIGSTNKGYGMPSNSGIQLRDTSPLDQTTFPQPMVMPSSSMP